MKIFVRSFPFVASYRKKTKDIIRGRRYYEKRRNYKKVSFVLWLVLLVSASVLLVPESVLGQEQAQFTVDEVDIRRMEQEYVSEIREYLSRCGYEHAGVTLTWKQDIEGNRVYQVALNHKKMEMLKEEQKQILFTEVKDLAFSVTGCEFMVKMCN